LHVKVSTNSTQYKLYGFQCKALPITSAPSTL